MFETELKLYEDAYRAAYADSGGNKALSRNAARLAMQQEYPYIGEYLRYSGPYVDRSGLTAETIKEIDDLVSNMGTIASRVVTELAPPAPAPVQPAPPSDNGNGHKKRTPVAPLLLNGLKAFDPDPGDVINLGSIQFWAGAIGCSMQAIMSQMAGNDKSATLKREGYTFEILDNNTAAYHVKVLTVPVSERDLQIATLSKQLDEARAIQDVIMNEIKRLRAL